MRQEVKSTDRLVGGGGGSVSTGWTLKEPIATKVVCFSCLLKCLRSPYDKQCGPRSDCSYIGAVWSGSTLFASMLNQSVILGNYLQQTTSADIIFQMHFFLALQGLNMTIWFKSHDQNSSQANIRGKNILQQNQRVNESGLAIKTEAAQTDNRHPAITKAHLEPMAQVS